MTACVGRSDSRRVSDRVALYGSGGSSESQRAGFMERRGTAAKKQTTSPTPNLLDGAAEAKLIALRLGKPPAGYGHWTLRLLADQLVELEIVGNPSVPKRSGRR